MKLIWSALAVFLLCSVAPSKALAKDPKERGTFFSDNSWQSFIVVDVYALGRDVGTLDTYFRLHGYTVLKTDRKHRAGSPTVFTVLLTTLLPALHYEMLRISQEAETAIFTLHRNGSDRGNGNPRPRDIYMFRSEINSREDVLAGNEKTQAAMNVLSAFGLIPTKFENLDREMGVGISMFLVDLSPLKANDKAILLQTMERRLNFGPYAMTTDTGPCAELVK